LTKTFNSNVYVKFIPNDVTEEQLRKTFTMKDSNIVSIKLTKFIKKYDNEETSPYQFAYILYDTVPAAQKAIQTFHLSTVFGHKPLLVELWVSKEEKEQENKKKEN
jgi:RNA recognition motif-containing protein